MPKPDADLCMRMDLQLDKKLWKIRTGLLGHWGPLGLQAPGPPRAMGRWAMGLLLAKPIEYMIYFIISFRSQVDLTSYTWTAIVFGQCLRFMVSNFLTDSSNLFD